MLISDSVNDVEFTETPMIEDHSALCWRTEDVKHDHLSLLRNICIILKLFQKYFQSPFTHIHVTLSDIIQNINEKHFLFISEIFSILTTHKSLWAWQICK